MEIVNKKTSRYRRLMEIRSRNSFRKRGLDPKKPFVITTFRGEKEISYKEWPIFKNGTLYLKDIKGLI